MFDWSPSLGERAKKASRFCFHWVKVSESFYVIRWRSLFPFHGCLKRLCSWQQKQHHLCSLFGCYTVIIHPKLVFILNKHLIIREKLTVLYNVGLLHWGWLIWIIFDSISQPGFNPSVSKLSLGSVQRRSGQIFFFDSYSFYCLTLNKPSRSFLSQGFSWVTTHIQYVHGKSAHSLVRSLHWWQNCRNRVIEIIKFNLALAEISLWGITIFFKQEKTQISDNSPHSLIIVIDFCLYFSKTVFCMNYAIWKLKYNTFY